uniref:GDP-Man:Man(3)GlcNAc(2)-PP-Dol alpha-1,2-mannosyltransferase n=1 Tax=Heterorhabditis bacteriophora TaxID=37862 RepID=A0A1I7WUN6_HETBA
MIYAIIFLLALLLVIRLKRNREVIAFFHPYCNAGGGGERVLWCAIRTMQKRWPNLQYIVYSGDANSSKEQILLRAKQRFGIEVNPRNVNFIFLRFRRLVEADLYPRFTLVAQTVAGLFLGLEALWRLNPGVFIDSMGYPLTLPLFKWIAGSQVIAYVHYPVISCDMIDLVSRRETSYNNADVIAQSNMLSHAKLLYYRIFAFFYGLAGKAADVVMVNGSWTAGHISRIWCRSDTNTLFPPCDVSTFLSLDQTSEERLIHLTIAGGCRNTEDLERVKSLQNNVVEMGLEACVFWKLNATYEELLDALSESLISIHTMWNEHFGISVVEGMAAGTVMLAHDSAGGPQMDIVLQNDGKGRKHPTGFLAATKEEYVHMIMNIVSMSTDERDELRKAARASVRKFSEEEFEKRWNSVVEGVLMKY